MPEGLQCGPLKIIQVNDNDNEPNTRGLNKAYSYPHHQPQLRREWRQPKNRNKRRNLIGPNTSIAKSNNYFVKANHNSNKVKQEQQRENNNIENFHASKIFDAISTTATQNSITSTVRARNPLRIYIRHSPDKLNTNHITSPFNNITGCNGTHNRKHTNLSRYASIHSKALTTSPPSPYLSKEETIRRTKATLLSNPILFLMLSNALLAAKVFMNSAATVATSTALLRPIVTLSAAVAASFAAAASNSAIGISPSLATLDLESAILEGGNSSSTNLSHISYGLNSSSSSEGVVGRGMSINGSAIVAFGDISFNDSDELTEDASEYVFDRTDVRIIFIALYTIVFCCCFFGNLLVILVVTLSRRLRSITNFFLANLALADFCVGLFCVMQNLSIYLIDSWVFGEFLCRMYQFVHSLSYTASIFILVVICMERYFAIVHPITCKQILTAARLRMVILTVWITSAVYSTPKFVFSKTIKNIHNEDGHQEEICVLDRKMFNSKLLDMINFVLLYVIPLLVMTVLYSKIAIALWRSSRGLSHHIAQQQQHDNNVSGMTLHNSMYHHHGNNQHPQAPAVHIHASPHQQQSRGQDPPNTPLSASSGGLYRKQSSKYEKRGVSITESQVSLDSNRPIVSACRKTSFYAPTHHTRHGTQRSHHNVAHMSHSSNNVLRARRGVVRMLIIFVLTFALCNLPYHARKMWQYWSRSYRGDSNFNALLTPLTFLVTYFNSGINPLLYAFLSRNFRKGMKELLLCSWKKGKGKSSSNSSMHHKRTALQTHSLPTDTTHIGNEQL